MSTMPTSAVTGLHGRVIVRARAHSIKELIVLWIFGCDFPANVRQSAPDAMHTVQHC